MQGVKSINTVRFILLTLWFELSAVAIPISPTVIYNLLTSVGIYLRQLDKERLTGKPKLCQGALLPSCEIFSLQGRLFLAETVGLHGLGLAVVTPTDRVMRGKSSEAECIRIAWDSGTAREQLIGSDFGQYRWLGSSGIGKYYWGNRRMIQHVALVWPPWQPLVVNNSYKSLLL